jgi:CRISPR/Cas system CSM-associated protein Csm5 (group 7 of RAMP superfamily)
MMKIEESMKTQTFEVEIITPSHIGGAAENHWQNGMDFVVRDNKTWILDFGKLSNKIAVDKLTLAFTRNDRNVSLENLISNIPIKDISSKSFNYKDSSKDIKRNIFNGFDGKPYIPGSSIKGAVSSILLNYFFRLPPTNIQKNKDVVKNTVGDFDNSIMRFFQFTDIQFQDSKLVNTKIFNLNNNNSGGWEGGWKHSRETNQRFNYEFTTVYETLVPKLKSTMMLSFKQKAIEQLFTPKNNVAPKTIPPTHTSAWLSNNPTAELCSIINKHTIDFLEKEIKFYEKYKFDDNSENVLENIRDLKGKVAKLDFTKECILRLAAGSGFHSITGDWQYDDYIETGEHIGGRNEGKRKYKSRKLAFENGVFQPMGFIKLTLLSKEEIEKAKQQAKEAEAKRLKEELKANEQAEQIAKDALIAEAERIKEEELAKIEASKPKMFEGILKAGSSIIDAEVESVLGNKAKLKLYAPNQQGNLREISYTGLTKGQTLEVLVKAIAKNGFIVAVEFKRFK